MRRFVRFQSSVSLKPSGAASGCALATFAKDDKKDDPDAIGDRNVSGKVNWFSLEKEIALGKQLAQQVERDHRKLSPLPGDSHTSTASAKT